jgi:hypothetical protein
MLNLAEFSENAYPRHIPWGIPTATRDYPAEKRRQQIVPQGLSDNTGRAHGSPAESDITGLPDPSSILDQPRH